MTTPSTISGIVVVDDSPYAQYLLYQVYGGLLQSTMDFTSYRIANAT